MEDVRRNQQLFNLVFLNSLREVLVSMQRANVDFSWRQYRYGQTTIPTMVPTYINTSIPTSIPTQNISRRLENSEFKLYEEETNENRQLQISSSSLEQCLLTYTKIVQIVAQITVPLPMNVTAADFELILENLLQDLDYINLINKWAGIYNLNMTISTKICGYVTLISEPSIVPTILPSIAPAVAPTFLPSTTFPTNTPTSEPTTPSTSTPSLIPSSTTPSTSTPSLIPSSTTPSDPTTINPTLAPILGE